MRLTYLTIPLFALVLAGCGDDDADTALPMDDEVPAEEAYGTPADPADMPMNDRPAPTNEPMSSADDPMTRGDDTLRDDLDRDPGLGTEPGGSPNERVDPGIDSDTTTEPTGDGL